jgi:hypothetical protein
MCFSKRLDAVGAADFIDGTEESVHVRNWMVGIPIPFIDAGVFIRVSVSMQEVSHLGGLRVTQFHQLHESLLARCSKIRFHVSFLRTFSIPVVPSQKISVFGDGISL